MCFQSKSYRHTALTSFPGERLSSFLVRIAMSWLRVVENWIKMTDTSSLKKTSENPQEGAEGSRFDQDGLTASQAQERVDIPFKVAWLFHSKLHVFFHWYSPQP